MVYKLQHSLLNVVYNTEVLRTLQDTCVFYRFQQAFDRIYRVIRDAILFRIPRKLTGFSEKCEMTFKKSRVKVSRRASEEKDGDEETPATRGRVIEIRK